MRKVIIMLLLFTATRTLISCCKSADYNFQWSKANLTNIRVFDTHSDILAGDSAKIENYGFRLSLVEERIVHQALPDFGVTSSYALSCKESYYNRDSVAAVDIRTRNNFDNTHPAGSSVVEYVIAFPGKTSFNLIQGPFRPINEVIGYFNKPDEISNDQLDCKFQNASPILGPHQFIVNVSFKSGRVLSDTTAVRFY